MQIAKEDVLLAQKILVDNGIEPDESGIVLQAIVNTLFNVNVSNLIEWSINNLILPHYCKKTVDIWLEGSKNENTNEVINKVKEQISRERNWLKTTFDKDEIFFQSQHLADLTEYLNQLMKRRANYEGN